MQETFDPVDFKRLFNITKNAFINNTKNANFFEQTKAVTSKEKYLADIIDRLLTDYDSYITAGEHGGIKKVILSAITSYSVLFSQICIDIEKDLIGKVYMCNADIILKHLASDSENTRAIGLFFSLVDDMKTQLESRGSRDGTGPGSAKPSDFVKEKPCLKALTPIQLEQSAGFAQIIGLNEAKKDLRKMYTLPYKYNNLFMEKTQGILLYGPPGTGKTMLAAAAAKEFNQCIFFAPKPGELKGKYVGETEQNIQHVFKCARDALLQKTPLGQPVYKHAIIFFDEFDSIAGNKSESNNMILSVNALLQEMDGISSDKRVSVIASTNFPWKLEDAVLRRFSKRIYVDIADPPSILHIIKQTIAKTYYLPMTSNFDRGVIAQKARNADNIPGFYTQDSNMQIILRYLESVTADTDTDNDSRLCVSRHSTLGKTAVTKPETPDSFAPLSNVGESADPADIEKYNAAQEKLAERGGRWCVSSISDITEIAKRFHPTSVGVRIKDKIMNLKKGETFDLSKENAALEAGNLFGYSPSDIKQVLSNAISNAAYRALLSPLYKHTEVNSGADNLFGVKTAKSSQVYFLPVSYNYAVSLQECWIAEEGRAVVTNSIQTYLQKTKCTDITIAEKLIEWTSPDNKKHSLKLNPVTENMYSRVINTTLTEGDFAKGMADSPSTIQNKKYVNLLLYQKQGKVPV